MEEGGEFAFPTATPEPRTFPRRAASSSSSAAAAAPPSLADVPDNIPVSISAFLRCRADRVHMACVNKLWSRAVRGVGRPPPPILPPLPALPPQLPWLIFPNTETPNFYSPITRRHHRLCRLPPDLRRARFCGSAGGGWLVLALESCRGYALYNLNSGRRIPLPLGFTTPGNQFVPLVAHAASFSAPPSGPNQYMVAAIVLIGYCSTAAFWSEGSEIWFSPGAGALLQTGAQDVIYYGDAFFFVTSNEDVISFRPEFWGNNVDLTRVEYDMVERGDLNADVNAWNGVGTMRRYLVESRGRLLMVVRYFRKLIGRTERIRVFQLQVMPPEAAAGDQEPRAIWQNLGNQLDGRMLFLGRGCSRSLEVADYNYNGIQEEFEESMIYFLDERAASELLPGPDGRMLYTFTDMGRYDMEENAAAPWPEGIYPTRSDNAPPTWWLHWPDLRVLLCIASSPR